MLEYMELYNCMLTIAILVCKQRSLTHLIKRLLRNYSLTNHMYNHLTVWKNTSSGSFKNVIYKLCVYKSYIMSIKRIRH